MKTWNLQFFSFHRSRVDKRRSHDYGWFQACCVRFFVIKYFPKVVSAQSYPLDVDRTYGAWTGCTIMVAWDFPLHIVIDTTFDRAGLYTFELCLCRKTHRRRPLQTFAVSCKHAVPLDSPQLAYVLSLEALWRKSSDLQWHQPGAR